MVKKLTQKLTNVKESDIYDYYIGKINYYDLSFRYGVSKDTMRKYFKAHGLLTHTEYQHSLTDHKFFEVYTSDVAYILGLYTADG